MQTVAIVGTGLIGSSFALALRKAGFNGRVVGVSSPGAIREALAVGAIDDALPLAQAAAQADLIYLSQTIARILETLGALDEHVKAGALVTDAGSTKAQIVARAASALRRAEFLGGHPMAGKEIRGAAWADADLFIGRPYVLTGDVETPAAREFVAWVRRIGAVPVVVDAAGHDRMVAATSHLPQLASTALAATLAEHCPDWRASGPGLTDSTRLALSPYEVWRDILATNRAEIDRVLAAYIAKLEQMRASLDTPGLEREFERASEFALKLRGR